MAMHSVTHVALRVERLREAETFYRGLLALEAADAVAEDGQLSGSPGMSVGHSRRLLERSCGSCRVTGPQESMTRARAASALWKPRARRKTRRTTLLRPSARPLLMPSRIAAIRPSRNLRMVLDALTNAGRRERLAREIHRSISSATASGSRSPAKIARKASLRVYARHT